MSLFKHSMLALTGAAAILGFSSQAHAADIPCNTAQLIVPWGAGGGTDVIFRQIVETVNKSGAKPQLQVVNIPGQGGNKGTKQAAKADADGCTLVAIHQSAITSYFTGRIDFTWDKFEPIAMMTRTASIIGANKDVPFNSLEELIAEAKKKPGEITAGGTFGSVSQFVFLLIEDAAGVKFKHVSYDGTKQRMTALLANNINIGEINLAATRKYIETGGLKALALMSADRLSDIPDVKTSKEQGVNIVYGVERGIMAPKGTPKAVLDHYGKLFAAAAKDTGLQASMKTKGTTITYMDPGAYTDHMTKTYAKWESIAKKVGVYKRDN